jgi:predicted ATPase
VPSATGLQSATILWDSVDDPDAFPFSIPALHQLRTLDLSAPVTFLTGENGSGKSTLVEAIAIVAGLNPEGGSRNLTYSQRPTESSLDEHLRLSWRSRPRWAYFMRAETFFNTATAYEGVGTPGGHERSHGEQFIETAMTMFKPGGFHLLDEPEAALSLPGQLRLLRCLYDTVSAGGQFLIATHSPVLLAYPGARIYALGPDGIEPTSYEDCEPYQLTRSFLEEPDLFLRHLLADDDLIEPDP